MRRVGCEERRWIECGDLGDLEVIRITESGNARWRKGKGSRCLGQIKIVHVPTKPRG